MHTYTARYGHEPNATPGDLRLDAKNDDEAIAEVRAFVADGYRNLSWASVPLQDGRQASYRNEHGAAVGGEL